MVPKFKKKQKKTPTKPNKQIIIDIEWTYISMSINVFIICGMRGYVHN
jgi:hypothetical protein